MRVTFSFRRCYYLQMFFFIYLLSPANPRHSQDKIGFQKEFFALLFFLLGLAKCSEEYEVDFRALF